MRDEITISFRPGEPYMQIQTKIFLETLLHYRGNILKASKSLKVSRATVYRWAKNNHVNLDAVKRSFSYPNPK